MLDAYHSKFSVHFQRSLGCRDTPRSKRGTHIKLYTRRVDKERKSPEPSERGKEASPLLLSHREHFVSPVSPDDQTRGGFLCSGDSCTTESDVQSFQQETPASLYKNPDHYSHRPRFAILSFGVFCLIQFPKGVNQKRRGGRIVEAKKEDGEEDVQVGWANRGRPDLASLGAGLG